jgi:hypothetical protein
MPRQYRSRWQIAHTSAEELRMKAEAFRQAALNTKDDNSRIAYLGLMAAEIAHESLTSSVGTSAIAEAASAHLRLLPHQDQLKDGP